MRNMLIIFMATAFNCFVGCRTLTESSRHEKLADYISDFFCGSVLQGALSKAYVEKADVIASKIKHEVADVFSAEMSTEELEQIIIIFNSPVLAMELNNLFIGDRLSGEGKKMIDLLETHSSGFRKMQSNLFREKIALKMLKIVQEE